MFCLNVIDTEGHTHRLTAEDGQNVMRIIKNASLAMLAFCGGEMECATCHVIVSEADFEKVGPPSEDEQETLEQGFSIAATSRLACQINMCAELDGLTVTLLPLRPD